MAYREVDLQTYAEEDITVGASAVGLTLSNIIATPRCKRVELFISGAQIRVTTHGTDPTASVGEVLNPFDRFTIKNTGDAERFKAIRTGGTSGAIRARYLR